VHILYVSDGDPDTYLTTAMTQAGHRVETAPEAADGLVMAADGDYDAILLDCRRPSKDRARRYGAVAAGALVIVVAAQGDEHERAEVLRAGADACFIRPLTFVELEARLQALGRVIRRGRPGQGGDLALRLLPAERAARRGGAQVALSPLEFRLLDHLIRHAGEVIGIDRIRRHVWGDDAEPRSEPVHGCASRLRRKLETIGAGACLQAVPGHGYLFRDDEASYGRRTATT
jgi:two-component system OmpR family response regulator